jgi:hypothetical protein
MACDIFAHPDSTPDPPPLHAVATDSVAEYISDYLQIPVLRKYSSDLKGTTEEKDSYLSMVRRLSETMSGYFRHAAGELKAGVTWALPDWIDLEINAEVTASDSQLVAKVSIYTSQVDVEWDVHTFYRRHTVSTI